MQLDAVYQMMNLCLDIILNINGTASGIYFISVFVNICVEIFSNREVIADEKVIENQWENIFKKGKRRLYKNL